MQFCMQIQLSFEACQLGGKFEVVALYRKDVFFQIEDYLHKVAVGGVTDYFPDLFESAEWIHLRTFCQQLEVRTSL